MMRSFNSVSLLFRATIAVVFLTSSSLARSSGAAECSAGNLLLDDRNAAPHRSASNIITGSLTDVGFKVFIDNKKLVSEKRTNVEAMVPHAIEIRAPKNKFFRGFLIRIEDPRGSVDSFDYLQSDDPNVQISEVCTDNEEAGGLTHVSNDEKTSIQGSLTTEFVDYADVVLIMDVTIVVQNRGDTSQWYYSRFAVKPVSGQISTIAPTPQAAPAPTKQPTVALPVSEMPTTSPTFVASGTPSAISSTASTTAPTGQLFANSTLAPSSSPTFAGTSESCAASYNKANACLDLNQCNSDCLNKNNTIDFGGICEATRDALTATSCSCLDPICPLIAQCCPQCENETLDALKCDLSNQASPCTIKCDPFNHANGNSSGVEMPGLAAFSALGVLLLTIATV